MFGTIESMFPRQPRNHHPFAKIPWRTASFLIGFALTVFLMWCGSAQAKRSIPPSSPIKITDVVIAPEPFLIGKSPVTFSMLVELPPYLNGANVLEVSALITSPTRRNMSFVAHRRILAPPPSGSRLASVPVVLVWDGKDQYRQLVPDGSYYYEIRAKLMEDEGFGPRTKVVSHRVQGTLDVLAYAGEVLPPVPPEPVLPEEVPDEIPGEVPGETPGEIESPVKEEELPVEDVPMVEEGLKATDDPVSGEVPSTDEGMPNESGEPSPDRFPEALPEISDAKKLGEQDNATGAGTAEPLLEPPGEPQHDPAIPMQPLLQEH